MTFDVIKKPTPIIFHIVDTIADAFENVVVNMYKKEDEIRFTASIDASQLGDVMQEDKEAMVSGPSLNYYIKYPVCTDNEIRQKNNIRFCERADGQVHWAKLNRATCK